MLYYNNMTKTQIQTILDNNSGITELYLELINVINVGIFIQDETTKVIACNDSSLELLGITFEQAFGTTAYHPRWKVSTEDGEAFPPTQFPVTIASKTNKACKDTVMGIYRPILEDTMWLLVSAVPLIRSTDSLKQVVVTFTDISGRVRETHEIKSKNKVLSNTNGMMIDRELKMVQLKKEIAELTKAE
jgi:PAS domain-containing protein